MDHMNALCSDNYDSTREMLSPDYCKYLEKRSSPSIVLVSVSKRHKTGETKWIRCRATGFVIDSSESILIMTCGHFLAGVDLNWITKSCAQFNSENKFEFKFYNEEESVGHMVYKRSGYDLTLFEVKQAYDKPSLRFFENEHEVKSKVPGLVIHSISHPICRDQIQPYTFTLGTLSKLTCTSITRGGIIDPDCQCVMYHMPLTKGSSGAPIMLNNGEVIAVHSNHDGKFYFGIGLGSIKAFLADYFDLSNVQHLTTNDVLSKGLEKKLKKVDD